MTRKRTLSTDLLATSFPILFLLRFYHQYADLLHESVFVAINRITGCVINLRTLTCPFLRHGCLLNFSLFLTKSVMTLAIGAVIDFNISYASRVADRLDDFGSVLGDPKLVDRNLIALEAGHRKGIKFERSSWSGAAGRTNAPETGRPSVNNGLEVGCGARRGGVAHAPAARAGRGAGDCASRQLLRARDHRPPRALPPMHRRCWRMPPVPILALRLRDSDIVLWPSLSWCLSVTYSVYRVVCVTMRMCSALPAAKS